MVVETRVLNPEVGGLIPKKKDPWKHWRPLEEQTRIWELLEDKGVTNQVKIAEIRDNGHKDTRTWIGGSLRGGLEINSLQKAGVPGCLRIEFGIRKVDLYFTKTKKELQGKVTVASEKQNSLDTDDSQYRMNL